MVDDPIDPLELRHVMARYPTGVTVVGTAHRGGGVCGLTANAVTSLSLRPPLLLACVHLESATHDCLVDSGVFSVNVLSRDQGDLAVRFADKRLDRFAGVPHEVAPDGTPLIEGAVARLRCRVEARHPGGDHSIFVGRVVAMEDLGGEPLVFWQSGYATLAVAPVPGD